MIQPGFQLSILPGTADLADVQRLRYAVFVDELGGDGPLVDHARRLETDRFDRHCDHLVLKDLDRPPGDQVVGTYRVMTGKGAQAAGGFYCETEYDLTQLKRSGHSLLELGRSCVHRDYRNGMAMVQLWSGLVGYARDRSADLLFGVASFHGTDPQRLAQPLSILHHCYRAPAHLCTRAKPPHRVPMDIVPAGQVDRVAAMRSMPPLIKAYLRIGGRVGDGAYVDHQFNTLDVCLVVDASTADLGRAIASQASQR